MKWPVFHAAINSSLLELIPIDTLTIVGRRSSNLILSNIIIESWNKSSFWFLTRIIDNYKIIQDISSKYHGNTTNPPHFQNTTPFIFGIENTTSGKCNHRLQAYWGVNRNNNSCQFSWFYIVKKLWFITLFVHIVICDFVQYLLWIPTLQ